MGKSAESEELFPHSIFLPFGNMIQIPIIVLLFDFSANERNTDAITCEI